MWRTMRLVSDEQSVPRLSQRLGCARGLWAGTCVFRWLERGIDELLPFSCEGHSPGCGGRGVSRLDALADPAGRCAVVRGAHGASDLVAERAVAASVDLGIERIPKA